MGSKTGIEWTDATWSPLRFRVKAEAAQICADKGYSSLFHIANKMAGHVGSHCEHVSPGCEHCYAETNNHRCLPANGTGLPYDRRSRDLVEPFIDEKILLQPLKWKESYDELRDGEGSLLDLLKRPRRIFVENQSDLFGDWFTDDMLDRVFAIMALCPQHTFQVLTKRPQRAWDYWFLVNRQYRLFWIAQAIDALFPDRTTATIAAKERLFEGGPIPNVLHGFSAENQETFDKRWDIMGRLAACQFSTFASLEPLLGPIQMGLGRLPGWVICGGESGPGARPMHPDWVRSLRDQCAAAGVPYFFKQWGEWSEVDGGPPNRVFDVDKAHCPIDSRNAVISLDGHVPLTQAAMREDVKYRWMSRIGKKAAGHLLDGIEWQQFPEAPHAA